MVAIPYPYEGKEPFDVIKDDDIDINDDITNPPEKKR